MTVNDNSEITKNKPNAIICKNVISVSQFQFGNCEFIIIEHFRNI